MGHRLAVQASGERAGQTRRGGRSRTRRSPVHARRRPSGDAASRRRASVQSAGDGERVVSALALPVTPSTTASSEPPLRPATWGTPHAAASRKTMPKPSLLEPRPAIAAQHRKDVAGGVDRRQVVVGDSTEEAHRRLLSRRPTRSGAAGGRAPACDRTSRSGLVATRRRRCLEQRSNPFRARAGSTPTITRPSGSRPSLRRTSARSVRGGDGDAPGVDPGGTTYDRQRTAAIAGPLERGQPPAATITLRAAKQGPSRITCWLTGKRPGTSRPFSAVQHERAGNRVASGRAARRGAQGRRHDQPGADVASEAGDAPRERRGRREQHAVAVANDAKRLARRPTPGRPGEAW